MNRPNRWRWRLLGSLVGAGLLQLAQANSTPPSTPDSSSRAAGDPADPPQWRLLQERCSKCHNSEDWAGGIAFDTMSPKDIASDAETWEKAMRKLRGRLMPPPGNPQPDQQTIDGFVSWMEGELDHASAGHPSPGNVGIHRLNRTEYAREINAILGLKVDVKTLLPVLCATNRLMQRGGSLSKIVNHCFNAACS